MAPLLIALIVLCCLLAAGAVYLLLALEVLPRFAAKKLRSGPVDETALSFPEDFDELRARVSVQRDLPYPSRVPSNKFDLYLPKDADKAQPLPLVVWIHGGGFIAGEKEGTENVMTCLAAAGYAAVSLDYPVAPEHRYPAAIKAIDAFFAFLPRLSERYPVDLTRIVLCGDSAGAQLAAQFAAKETNARPRALLRKEQRHRPSRLPLPPRGSARKRGPCSSSQLPSRSIFFIAYSSFSPLSRSPASPRLRFLHFMQFFTFLQKPPRGCGVFNVFYPIFISSSSLRAMIIEPVSPG